MNALELKWLRQATKSSAVFKSFVKRRLKHEPLQYILGTQPFGSLDLVVRPPVLIPRPETEHWTIKLAEQLSRQTHRPLKLIDLGTGSGCIPLLVCRLLPPASVSALGVDISADAVHLARENAARCGIPSFNSQKLSNTFNASLHNFLSPLFLKSTLFHPEEGQDVNMSSGVVSFGHIGPPFDVLTSNPPYISWNEYLELPEDVLGYEDPMALFGGPSGLEFYHAIANIVADKEFLSPGALIALEVGHGQADIVSELLSSVGVSRTEVWLDPWGKPRTVIARK